MSQEAFERGDWMAVIDAHRLESHDPQDWLRYGVALLQTIPPGPEEGRLQQQAALAFVQALKEGAPKEAVEAAQRRSVLLSLAQAMNLAEMETGATQFQASASCEGIVAIPIAQQSAGDQPQINHAASIDTPYHYRTAIPLRFSYLSRQDERLILNSTHNYGYFSCLSTILWDLITCVQHNKKPALVSSLNGMKHFKDHADADLFQLHFCPPENQGLNSIPDRDALRIPAHHGDYRNLDFEALRPFINAYFKPIERIEELVGRIELDYAIDPLQTIALCYRGTDKSLEVPPVPVEEFLCKAEEVLKQQPGARVLVQTDQKQIRDLLLDAIGDQAFAVNELPVTEGNTAIHLTLCEGKQHFADHLLAINLIMAKCRWVITHTGNVAFWTVLLRGNCENVVQFGALADP